MQTEDQIPRIAMTPRYRDAKMIEIGDVIDEAKIFANLIRMAAASLDDECSDAIAQGAIELATRLNDASGKVAALRAAV